MWNLSAVSILLLNSPVSAIWDWRRSEVTVHQAACHYQWSPVAVNSRIVEKCLCIANLHNGDLLWWCCSRITTLWCIRTAFGICFSGISISCANESSQFASAVRDYNETCLRLMSRCTVSRIAESVFADWLFIAARQRTSF